MPRISISCWPLHESVDTTFAWIAIHDNRARAFRPSRGKKFLNRVAGWPGAHPDGTGMGLSIVRKIVQHYGGQAFVAPSAEGTTIVVSLPAISGEMPTG